jgi:hypothetical protein
MNFWDDCKEHSSVCWFGALVGAIIMLILVLLYKTYYVESFQDPNSMDPITQSLLQQHYRGDPVVTKVPTSMMAAEYLSNKAEHPKLVSQLWA